MNFNIFMHCFPLIFITIACAVNVSPVVGFVVKNPIPNISKSISSTSKDTLNETVEQIDHIHDNCSRRGFLSVTCEGMAVLFLSVNPKSSFALDDENIDEKKQKQEDRLVFKGKVTLQSGTSVPDDISASALYVTARPNNPVDVPRAILDGSNGKPPPVLAARFSNVQFPFTFDLRTSDLTLEGNASRSDTGLYWWEEKDLIVSARWDTDGTAATRDPTDLVGREMFIVGSEEISIQLQGRGITGKFFTGKANR